MLTIHNDKDIIPIDFKRLIRVNSEIRPKYYINYTMELVGQRTPRTSGYFNYKLEDYKYYVGKINKDGYAIKDHIYISTYELFKFTINILRKKKLYNDNQNACSLYIGLTGYYNHPYHNWLLVVIDFKFYIITNNNIIQVNDFSFHPKLSASIL